MNKYQLIIVGAGPAGMTAGIYAGRAGVKALVLDKLGFGGQMLLIHSIENFPGFDEPINGFDLAQRMYSQMMKYGAEHKNSEVKSISARNNIFEVVSDEGVFEAETVIIASGALPKKLNIPGESKFIGRGVSYCAVCDGNFFKDKKAVVIGGGNTALQDAEYLSKIAREVVLIHRRDEFRGDKILQERAARNSKISFKLSCKPESIEGVDKVNAVKIKNLKTNVSETVDADGVFIFVGQEPQNGFVKSLIDVDERGFVKSGAGYMSSQKGIFACGDCRRDRFWQLVTACAEGAEAANAAAEYLINK